MVAKSVLSTDSTVDSPSPVAFQSDPSRKRSREISQDEDADDQGKRCSPGDDHVVGEKRLACPFFKRNSLKYKNERSCVGPGWSSVHRIKYVHYPHFVKRR
jgi:hypothetical protein